jgi:NitT/TauT family transport system permease protein
MSSTRSAQADLPATPGTTRRVRRAIAIPYAPIILVFIVIAWELAVRWGGVSRIVLPRPSAVIMDLVAHWRLFTIQALRTLMEIVVGFVASFLVAVPLAILISSSRLLERSLYPLIAGAQTVPVVSIAPILLAWFGFGLMPKVIVVVLISFFPIMMNTCAGMKAMSEQIGNLARSIGASRLQLLWHFQLPGALPSMFAGMKVGITLAVIGAVVAEFVGSDSGLGYEIMVAGSNLDLAHQFGAVAILSLLGLVLLSGMTRLERLCVPWHVSIRTQRKN